MSITINAAVCSNVGRVRSNNEDNFYFNGAYMDESNRDKGGTLSHSFSQQQMVFAVCDGMGGTARGEDASFCAVRMLDRFAKSGKKVNDPAVLRPVMQSISDEVEEECRGSGTTIVMVSISDGVACISHVGDSRVYTVNNGALSRATVDHSEVQRMYSMGLITREQMATHPKRNMINQFLGMPRSEAMVAPGFTDGIILRDGMRFMLCSDGLTDMVDDETIQRIINTDLTVEEICVALVRKALENGGKDNVTVMALEVYGNNDNANAYEKTLVPVAHVQHQNSMKENLTDKKAALAKWMKIKTVSLIGMAAGALGLIATMVMAFIQ